MPTNDDVSRYLTGAVLPLYETTDDQAARVARVGNDPLLPENRDFIYPDRRPRASGPSHAPLDRGYIRSVADAENKLGLPSVKCQFQFNPEVLTHSIAQRSDMLNFFAMTPADFATPIGGNVSFNFSMIFDRSMELNRNVPNPAPESPEEIGVLHDINTLYKVIGVGMNSDYARAADERSYVNQAIRASSGLTSDDDTEDDSEDRPDADTALGNVEEYLRKNEGNHAFLIPLPVRVVFSEHYMVEGLVQNVDVTYGKFNRNMVPMQCSVAVTMEAKYLGFYKTNTFFTDMLQQFGEEDFETTSTAIVDPTIREAIESDLSRVTMYVTDSSDTAPSQTSKSFSTDGGLNSLSKIHTNVISRDISLFPDINIEDRNLTLRLFFSPKTGGSELAKLSESGEPVTVTIGQAEVSLYRYHNSVVADSDAVLVDRLKGVTYGGYTFGNHITTSSSAGSEAKDFVSALEDWHQGTGVSADYDNTQLLVEHPSTGSEYFAKVMRVADFRLDSDTVSSKYLDNRYKDIDNKTLTFTATSNIRELITGGIMNAGDDSSRNFPNPRLDNPSSFADSEIQKDRSIAFGGRSAGNSVGSPIRTDSSWFGYAAKFSITLRVAVGDTNEEQVHRDAYIVWRPHGSDSSEQPYLSAQFDLFDDFAYTTTDTASRQANANTDPSVNPAFPTNVFT